MEVKTKGKDKLVLYSLPKKKFDVHKSQNILYNNLLNLRFLIFLRYN